jgi:LemA protein
MKSLGMFFGGLLVVVLLAFAWYKSGYDTAAAKDEKVKSAWAQVENQLQRRNDLIPNLVNTVKGFVTQEKDILLEVTRLRSQWAEAQTVNDQMETANELSGALSRLLLVTENYPQLKSNENFLTLQSQLEGTENRITVERMRYNQAVEEFNSYHRSLIGKLFTEMIGVKEPAVYFKAEEMAKEVPQVAF